MSTKKVLPKHSLSVEDQVKHQPKIDTGELIKKSN